MSGTVIYDEAPEFITKPYKGQSIESPFELGDRVVLMGRAIDRDLREPMIEGSVSARGSGCVRIAFQAGCWPFKRIKQKWCSINHRYYHIERTQFL